MPRVNCLTASEQLRRRTITLSQTLSHRRMLRRSISPSLQALPRRWHPKARRSLRLLQVHAHTPCAQASHLALAVRRTYSASTPTLLTHPRIPFIQGSDARPLWRDTHLAAMTRTTAFPTSRLKTSTDRRWTSVFRRRSLLSPSLSTASLLTGSEDGLKLCGCVTSTRQCGTKSRKRAARYRAWFGAYER